MFDDAADSAGDKVEVEFPEPGVYPYFSNTEADIANGMVGTVVVEPNAFANNSDKSGDFRARGTSGWDWIDESDEIILFEGAVDIDLVELTLAESCGKLISAVDLPAGAYAGIRLSLENPRLVLKSDPGTVITDVDLTSDGELFIFAEFDAIDGDDLLIALHLGDVYLMDNGDGSYVLVLHFTVTMDDDFDDAYFEGVVSDIADDLSSILVELPWEETAVEVFLGPETEFCSWPSEEPLGPEDLAVDQFVLILGLVNDDGSVDAEVVKIFEDDYFDQVAFEGEVVALADDFSSMDVALYDYGYGRHGDGIDDDFRRGGDGADHG